MSLGRDWRSAPEGDVLLAPLRRRAGLIGCGCDDDGSDFAPPDAAAPPRRAWLPDVARVAIGFAATVLTQALTLTVLPIAGTILGPHDWRAGLPYGLTLVGTVAATLPAALLADRHRGRGAGLALGGSLGLAGAALAAFAIAVGQWPGLLLGSLWLGMAQGFGLYFRHSGATSARHRPRAIALVLGAGGLAAVVAPSLMRLAEIAAGPLAPSAALLMVGLVQLGLIGLASTPEAGIGGMVRGAPPDVARAPDLPRFALATAAGAAAWFGMALAMAGTPGLMALCGVPRTAFAGAIAWHMLWMYAPAALFALWCRDESSGTTIGGLGLGLLVAGLILLPRLGGWVDAGIVLALAGSGWSLATLGTAMTIHARATPSPLWLALHDAALLCGAIAGALAAVLLR